jgi:hypothetical protein
MTSASVHATNASASAGAPPATVNGKQLLVTEERVDRSGALAREISDAPRGTTILSAGATLALPTLAEVRAAALRSVVGDFQRGVAMRAAQTRARPFRLTDVPPERFRNSVRRPVDSGGASPTYDAMVKRKLAQQQQQQEEAAAAAAGLGAECDAARTARAREEAEAARAALDKRVTYFEDTNYVGVANLQIYAFFGLTAVSGLGTVLIIASVRKMPQLTFALPFALFSGWQMFSFYESTTAAARQATKVQFLRMVQGGVTDPQRQSYWVKARAPQPASNKPEEVAA